MSCFRPLIAVPFPFSHPKYGQFHVLGSATKVNILEPAVDPRTGQILEPIRLPCGKCVGCKLDRSREMATRIVCESMDYPENSNFFVTLTYGDSFESSRSRFTRNEDGALILDKRHVQLFFKSLREGYEREFGRRLYDVPTYFDNSLDKEIELGTRFYMAGEYGDRTFRPHYHVCLMNTPLPDLYQPNSHFRTTLGQPLYRSPYLEKCWKYGQVVVGKLTFQSAAYVARYCLKKADKELTSFYETAHLSPEFTNCSRRPGIGYNFVVSRGSDLYEHDQIVLPSISKDKPNIQRVPKYFDKKYSEIDPRTVSLVKSKRAEVAELMNLSSLDFTDLDEESYLCLKEQRVNEKAKKLFREFSNLS